MSGSSWLEYLGKVAKTFDNENKEKGQTDIFTIQRPKEPSLG